VTTAFDPPQPVVRRLVEVALAEDLGVLGDITSNACIGDDQTAVAAFVAREAGVLAGTALADETYRQVDAHVEVKWSMRDGEPVEAGTELGRVSGALRAILVGERTALNFLCHCSGIASTTRRYVRATHGKARILDTRKTLPGLRAVQKAAVRAGGGFNHRESLSDAVLIKDNHLAVLGLARAVERTQARWPGRMVAVECDSLDQVAEACAAGVDRVLVDNMSAEDVRKAVALVEGRATVEVSGGITLETVGAYAEAGAEFISIGALTHSARALDIGLDVL
jgi:nicotinate-nucleotide pyrophosphorylase (carboxylating)